MEEREAVVRDFMIILKFFGIKPTGNFLADLKTLGKYSQALLSPSLSYEFLNSRVTKTKQGEEGLTATHVQKHLWHFMFNSYDSDGTGRMNDKELQV